jgi:hypothetical protein
MIAPSLRGCPATFMKYSGLGAIRGHNLMNSQWI